MRILLIVIGILNLFSSCTSRKRKVVEEKSALNEFVVEKSEFRPNAFPMQGKTLFLILREYNNRGDGTRSAVAEAIALLPEERRLIVDAYMNGHGERQREIYTAANSGGDTENREKRPNYSQCGYWAFTDQKNGTEGTEVLPYMNKVSELGSADEKETYALFGDDFCEKLILTKKDQQKVDSIIAKYDLGRRYDKKYPVDKVSQRVFAVTAEYEKLDIAAFNKKAIKVRTDADSGIDIREYCDTLPDKTIILYRYWHDRDDTFYRKEATRLDYISEIKQYDATGMIREQYWAISRKFSQRIGNTYYYDCRGKLIKTVCEDNGFEISFLQFQDILWRNAYYMPNYMQNGSVHPGRTISLSKGKDKGVPYYEYREENFPRYIIIKVDGITGQILSKEIGPVLE